VGARLPGLGVAAIGIAAALLARRIPGEAGFGLGPAFLPFWTAVLLAGSGGWVALRPAPVEASWRGLARAGAGLAVLLAYALALTPLGYVAATAAFLGAGTWLLEPSRPARALVVGVAGALFLRLLFGTWLGVPLPGGAVGW
jgi:putative tricarboxylic transport membrane protein